MSDSTDNQERDAAIVRSKRLPIIIGCISWAAPPIGYGVYVIAQEQAYFASRPSQGQCGMGMMLGYAMIVCVAPLCGMVGAMIGWIIRSLYSH